MDDKRLQQIIANGKDAKEVIWEVFNKNTGVTTCVPGHLIGRFLNTNEYDVKLLEEELKEETLQTADEIPASKPVAAPKKATKGKKTAE